MRSQLAAVTDHLARAQPTFGEEVAIGAAGRMGVDYFYYVPPRTTAWLSLGRAFEIGGDWAVKHLSWVRLTGAIEVMNLATSFGSSPPPVAFVPVVGLDALPASLGSPAFQPSFLLRGGYMLSPNDSFGGSPCEGQDRVTIGACSRPAVEAGAAAAVVGVLRLQLMFAWYPPAFGSARALGHPALAGVPARVLRTGRDQGAGQSAHPAIRPACVYTFSRSPRAKPHQRDPGRPGQLDRERTRGRHPGHHRDAARRRPSARSRSWSGR